MEFRLLGPLEAWQDGQLVHLGDRQQRYVLAALLLEANKPVPVDRLAEIIWGPASHESATTLVNTYISRLRRIFTQVGAENVRLDKEPGSTRTLRVDVEHIDYFRFQELRVQARVAQRSGDDGRALTLLHEAYALWRGAFLADLDNDELRRPYQRKLAHFRMETLYDLARLEFDNGNYGWVIDQLHNAVFRNPRNERLAVLLGRAMLKSEDRLGALTIAQRSARALRDSRMTPTPELEKIQQRALRGEPEHVPAQLPRDPPLFTGRKVELDALLTGWWAAVGEPEDLAVRTISGMPGVGKTALAIHTAHRLAHHFPDGQLVIDLHGFTLNMEPLSPGNALERLLKVLGVPGSAIPDTTEDRAALYRSTLAGTRRLILLDNAKDEAQVEPLLPGTAGALVIITSRRRLSGLDHFRGVHLEPLPADDAVALLRKIVGPDRVDRQNEAAEQIVRLSGQLPLAVRLVAGRLLEHPNWELTYFADLLQRRADRLVDFDPTERRLVATFCVSYEQLTGRDQRVFQMLGAVPGTDFDARAAAALAEICPDETEESLESLHRVSLVEDSTPGRYRIHDLLRTYTAIIEGTDPAERDLAVLRLLGYYLTAASAAAAVVFPHDRHRLPPIREPSTKVPEFCTERNGLNWLLSEHGNLVAAIRYAALRGWHEFTWKLACAVWRYLYIRGHLDDWSDTLRLALDAARRSDDMRGQALTLQHLSVACWRSGDSEQAVEFGRQALELWVRLGDRHGAADSYSTLGLGAKRLGRFAEARDHYRRAMSLYVQLDDRRGYANVLDNLADIDERSGFLQSAREYHDEALSILREVHDRQGELYVLNNIGGLQQQLGNFEEAVGLHERALAISEEIEYPHGMAFSFNYLGAAYREMAQLDTASGCHERAMSIASRLGDPTLETEVNNATGETLRARGEALAAVKHHERALSFANRTGDIREQARAHYGIACALHADDGHDKAADHWRQAVALYRRMDTPEADRITAEISGLGCGCTSV